MASHLSSAMRMISGQAAAAATPLRGMWCGGFISYQVSVSLNSVSWRCS